MKIFAILFTIFGRFHCEFQRFISAIIPQYIRLCVRAARKHEANVTTSEGVLFKKNEENV